MTTDSRDWTASDFMVFAQLLRISPVQIVPHKIDLEDRAGYFSEITQTGDIFFDPDIGVATGQVM
jgi:hypothetical protein